MFKSSYYDFIKRNFLSSIKKSLSDDSNVKLNIFFQLKNNLIIFK